MKTGKMVLLAALVLLFGAYSAPAATIIVNPGDNIQTAINAAPNGSTIKIKAGTYIKEIIISGRSRLKLIGAGAGKTIIDGTGGAGDVVTIRDSKKITLQQCTIENGVNDNIAIDNGQGVKILRNEITAATNYGIHGDGINQIIQGNQIKANGTGMHVWGYHNLIVKNTITGNSGDGIEDAGIDDKIIKNMANGNTGNGITISGGGPVKTQLNTVTDNGGFGIYDSGSAHQNVYMKNTVQHNGTGGICVYVGAMVIKNTVTDNTGDGIDGRVDTDGPGPDNILISNIIKGNTGMGIYLVADGHYLKGNLVAGNGEQGIYIDASDTMGMSQVLKNKVLNNGDDGIELVNCNLSVISNNFCAGNPGWGIYGGSNSLAVIYTKNKVNNNLDGLAMTANGFLDYVARNVVANNQLFGIDANGGSMMTFEKNVIIGNGTGLYGFATSLVSRNKILNNTGNGIDASSGSSSLIEKNIVKGNGDGASTFDLYDSPSPTDDWWQKNQYLTESL